jgi:hypothetical protein
VVLAVIMEQSPIAMMDLLERVYGETSEPFTNRMRMQISTLRRAGHEVVYDRRTRTYSLRRLGP